MANYSYPTSYELTQIGRDFMAAMALNDPIFRHFPIVDSANHLLEWWQKDNYRGLQMVRGLNGEPGRVAALGGKKFIMEPGVYGEFLPIMEDELTRRAAWASRGEVIDLSELVTEKTEQLTVREISRIRQILWALATAGAFSVVNEHGAVVHSDTYTTQTYDTLVPWSTGASATPIRDMQAVALKDEGFSLSLGPDAVAYANRRTVFQALNNTNNDDLGGRRVLQGPFSLTDANRIFIEQGLPPLEIMDDGYYDDAGVFQLFLPTGTVVVFGQRPGNEPAGEFRRTRNANNPGFAPGPYDEVYVNPKPPKNIEVHRGMNGGPALFYPSSIVRMNVAAGS
jgi:hypothetical protein